MRIAFFVQYSNASGTYFRWHNLAIALKEMGHEVDVFAGDHDWKSRFREEVRDEIQYYIVPALMTARIFPSPNDPFSAWRRMMKLPKKHYDVYHLFQPFLQAYFPWRYLKLKNRRAIFIYDWDDLWLGGLFLSKTRNLSQLYAKYATGVLEKGIPRFSDGVTVCSDFLASKVRSQKNISLIGNGFWSKPAPEKESMRIKWGLEKHIFYLAYIGKTTGEMDWILEALAGAVEKYNNTVKLIICGPPSSALASLGISKDNEHIIYKGQVSSTEASEIAAAADLGMVPLEDTPFNRSRFPIKFFDFLTVGTPVYLTEVGEVGKLAKSLTGTYIGPANKEKWKQQLPAIIESIKEEPLHINTVALSDQFSWPAIAKRLSSFYEMTIAKKTKKGS